MSNPLPAASPTTKRPRDRSPSFPFIPLQSALERLVTFEKYFGRHAAPAAKAGLAWGLKEKSSQADQIAAALRSFGLVQYRRNGTEREVILTEEARTFLRAQQESVKKQVIKQSALRPKIIRQFWATWGADRPPEAVCLDELTMKNGFSDVGAKAFLTVYDATIAFAGLSASDKIGLTDDANEEEDEESDPPPPPSFQAKVGDYVQWISNGVEQFKLPRRIVGIFPGGTHAQVFGSNAGVPMSELSVVDPPAPSLTRNAPARVDASSAWGAGENELNVLQKGNRLQISADVDLEGLAQLKEILGDYESILKRLAGRRADLLKKLGSNIGPPGNDGDSE
jgi:hypothetical protein